MNLRSLPGVAWRRAMIRLGAKRTFSCKIGDRPVVFAPVLRQSRLLDELVDHGIWSYEPELAHLVFTNPFGYSHFVDGGAHIALFSIMAECSGRYETVTAIEASPHAARYIEGLKRANSLSFALHECALGEQKGSVSFEIPETGYLMPSHSAFKVSALYKNQVKRSITTPVEPLAGFLRPGPTLVKLDCEGAEEAILRAMAEELHRRNDLDFVLEIMINDATKGALFQVMKAAGYSAYLMTNGGLVREDRPLTLPVPGRIPARGQSRTVWRNHFFTKRDQGEVESVSLEVFGYFP